MRERIGHYRLTGSLGEGGMGVVYAARDERLDRPVALKMIRGSASDPRARERRWREARAAARVNHPNVCQLYEIGEEDGELFIAMELLEGRPLADRIAEGPVPPIETMPIALAMLGALEVLHREGVIHRDLKPSNVFLTRFGVKLLDFGLAQPLGGATETDVRLTRSGDIVGTPRYMAPEQWAGEPADARTDLFAAAAILYEMLTAKPVFAGNTAFEVYESVRRDQPPALVGSPAVEAVDRVIHRALAKAPAERYPSAETMSQDLRAALRLLDSKEPVSVRSVTRLIVLPFRMLRPDPDTEFLAFSLPDAVSSTLSGDTSLVVRSSLAASRYAGEAPDLRALASEAEVDAVVTGTLLRAGTEIRVTTQLVEVPAGTLVRSLAVQAPLGDLFQLQDDLARRIAEALSQPKAGREPERRARDVPGSARAYELYLRANQLSTETQNWTLARDLYLECVREDPRYAPAWAGLGRAYRVLSKYTIAGADENLRKSEDAFRRALELNPDLSAAHHLYAHLEVELGRTRDALLRLLGVAQTRPSDPRIYAGLVLVCRYCGLLDASLAADRQARRLDSTIPTSVSYTYWMMGEYQRAADSDRDDVPFMRAYALTNLFRGSETIDTLRQMEARPLPEIARAILVSQRTALSGDREESLAAVRAILASGFRDPEGLYFAARTLAYLGAADEAVPLLLRVVEGGFYCYPAMQRDPWLDSLRAQPDFNGILSRAEALSREAAAALEEAGGERILGVVSG